MKTFRNRIGIAALLLGLTVSGSWAEEGLLWKVTSRYQPMVVPPYTGQASPFPQSAEEAKPVDEQANLEALELERRQQTVIEKTDQLINSPQAFMPYLEGMRIGGVVEGSQGRKVLLGNDWVGKGSYLNIRLAISEAARQALDEVAQFDPESAARLRSELTQKLQGSPLTKMKLVEIRKDALVLQGGYGEKVLRFNVQ